ncbi:carboxymuconolactone decarboxylase family protein, partial [Allorhizocola rhizosphaerae]|uniref:carboxymuconolactone decarboxylase family protein n=1 Tax=Allorhizocola rhizosphaerae TaxID=1872709 RepID=UPI000E3C0A36
MSQMFAAMTRNGALSQIRHIAAVPEKGADPRVAHVYRAMERDFGMLAPPVALHAPAPATLAASWVMLRETLLVCGAAPRETKETVATAVSLANRCPYCVEVHGSALDGLLSSRVVTAGGLDLSARPELDAVARWAGAAGERETALREGPAVPELIGVAVTFHYLNRVTNVFLTDSPLPGGVPVFVRNGVKRLLTRLAATLSNQDRRPGDSLPLLPAAALPEDLRWAAGTEHVAGALARAGAAIDAAGMTAVPEVVRRVVFERLAGWDRRPPGPSRAWLDGPVSDLPDTARAAGRLALLTAFAS